MRQLTDQERDIINAMAAAMMHCNNHDLAAYPKVKLPFTLYAESIYGEELVAAVENTHQAWNWGGNDTYADDVEQAILDARVEMVTDWDGHPINIKGDDDPCRSAEAIKAIVDFYQEGVELRMLHCHGDDKPAPWKGWAIVTSFPLKFDEDTWYARSDWLKEAVTKSE